MKKKTVQNAVIILFFLITSFIFLLNSPLHIWIGTNTSTDSSVFKTIAFMIQNGEMPYLHSFDHKGPYIYIVNWIGMNISYYRGIWVIELLNLFVTTVLLYRIARLKCSKLYSVVISILAISLLFSYFQGGNLTEEYAMPLISAALYIFLDYLLNKKINNIRLIICGICLGGVVLLRINMVSVWLVFCPIVLIQELIEKKYAVLKRFIFLFGLGFGLIVIPTLIWLGINGAILDFWNEYIVFNKIYSSNSNFGDSFENQWNTFFYFLNNTVIIIAFIVSCINFKINKNLVHGGYLVYIVLTLVLICISGRKYDHYGMILVPMVVYPFSVFYQLCEDYFKDDSYRLIKSILSMYLVIMFIFPVWIPLIEAIPSIYNKKDEKKFTKEVETITQIIEERTTEQEKISVYGNWDLIYLKSKRMHATKYSYQFPIGEVMPSIMDEYMIQLKEELPSMVVIQAGRYDNNIGTFLADNNYNLIFKANENEVLENTALLFQLNK